MTVVLSPKEVAFENIFYSTVNKTSELIGDEIDPRMFQALAFFRDDPAPPSPCGGKALRYTGLAEAVSASQKRVRSLVRGMAYLGLIRVTVTGPKSASVEIHPEILPLIDPKEQKYPAAKLHEVARRIDAIRHERECECVEPENMQGFHSQVPFGEREPDRILTPVSQSTSPGSSLYREAREEAKNGPKRMSDKDREKLEKKQRAAMVNKFVKRCGEVWMRGQIALGRMKATDPVPPSWFSVEPRTLSDGDKKKYNTLGSHFLRYGTLRTGLAWAIFCGTNSVEPTFADGKKRPFVHWVGEDKSPLSFDKHLMAVFTDEVFQHDLGNEKIQAQVEATYGADLIGWNGDENLPIPGGAR